MFGRATFIPVIAFATLVSAMPAKAGYYGNTETTVAGDGTTYAKDPKWEGLQAHVRPMRHGPNYGRASINVVVNDLQRQGYFEIALRRDRGDIYVFTATDRYGDRVSLKVNAHSAKVVGHRVLGY